MAAKPREVKLAPTHERSKLLTYSELSPPNVVPLPRSTLTSSIDELGEKYWPDWHF